METTNNIMVEQNGINIENEKSLHASIKRWYLTPGDRLEVKVGSYIIDIVRQGLLIEIQTKNFFSIGKKLKNLARDHKILLVYPVPVEKSIVVLDDEGNLIRTRKSPKKGRAEDIFDELIRAYYLINEDNISIDILMTVQKEIRINDGNGSWRRQGFSIVDKQLVEVIDKISLKSKEDYLKFLPYKFGQVFTNKSLAKDLELDVRKARKITYCLKKAGLIDEVGKMKNELIFQINK